MMTKHVVGFSGGIDSQACALWVRRHFPPEDVILLNTQAGRNEHPMTVEFVEWYSKNVFPVTVVTPLIKDLENNGTEEGAKRDRRREYEDDDEMTFADLAYIEGRFPSSKAQFCTRRLKLVPQKRWLSENVPEGYERYVGVRREESKARSQASDREWDEYFDCYINRPIAAWTKAECFAYVVEAGEEYNQLYKMGFSRVGCAPCINASKEDIREWAARFPEMIDKLRGWEARVGRTFFAPCVPGMEINFVDDVVRWAKTERGGKQFSLPFVEADADKGNCVSKYKLCE
jgi:3'-phosphoadenosine 5'-phosphosulfate sulfotransferase (PAPS reductase)/FAD synthetase